MHVITIATPTPFEGSRFIARVRWNRIRAYQMIRQPRIITAAQENLANNQSALHRAGAQIMAPKPESHYDKFGCALEAASACFSGLANDQLCRCRHANVLHTIQNDL